MLTLNKDDFDESFEDILNSVNKIINENNINENVKEEEQNIEKAE